MSYNIVSNDFTIGGNAPMVKSKTMKSGSIFMNNTRKAIIVFDSAFEKIPRVTLSQDVTSALNPFTSNVSRTGFTINFTSQFTGTVEFVALERE